MKKSRFAPWQEAHQQSRETIIDDFLKYLRATRVRVRFATHLADLVARHVAQVQGKPCVGSTLMRNNRYKVKILSYQEGREEPGLRSLNQDGISDPSARALLTSKTLENSNMKREIERLNCYSSSLEEELDQLRPDGRRFLSKSSAELVGQSGTVPLSDYEYRFIRTCQALRTLLNQMNVVLEVDTTAQQILDRSKRRNNVVVGKELAGPFVEWLIDAGGGEK